MGLALLATTAIVLGASLVGISVVTRTPAPAGPTRSDSPSTAEGATDSGTPAPIALADGFRLEGPWIVAFSVPREPVVTEILVLTPRCSTGGCDVDVQIQDLSGRWLGDAVFEFEDGIYRLESESTDRFTCMGTPYGSSTPATRTAATALIVAGYRSPGSGSTSSRIQGTRTVTTSPTNTAICEAKAFAYTALGEPTRFAATATARPTPRPAATPRPPATPKPATTPKAPATPTPPKVAIIRPSFFGSGVAIRTYRVKGSTAYDIWRSMSAKGPYSAWLGGRAAGLTRTNPSYRWHMETDWYGSCRIARDARPAIRITFTIVLPRWKTGSAPAVQTVYWWNHEVRGIAAHEKVHVDIYRAAQKRLNAVLATSACLNVKRRLDRVWAAAQRDNCEFDMKEYGAASGLSLKACLAR